MVGVASLRVWLLAAMVVSAVIGLGGASVIYGRIERAHERSSDRAKALGEARAVARQVRAGAGPREIAALQSLLASDQLTVVRHGRVIFRGARPAGQFELRVRVTFPAGAVTLADYSSASSANTLELLLVTGGVVLLVIAVAALTATLVTREVRGPVDRAIAAAEQVSHGELTARMGTSGPVELAKLGRAFDSMAARLERADRDQRQFLADVAHEIATPVNSISGFALALADGTSQAPAERAEARELIEAETTRLRELLADLRQLTHLDFTEGVRSSHIALEPFARGLITRFATAAAEAGVSLAVRVRAREAVTDVRLLETVLSNLISNAVRYTPRGGRVVFAVRAHRDRIVFAVRDTGVGIAPEHRDRIFERLYRVDATRDRATGGSGLGLAIAARAAQSLGGHLELDSTLGKGSEFRFVLPTPASARRSGAPSARDRARVH